VCNLTDASLQVMSTITLRTHTYPRAHRCTRKCACPRTY